MSKKEIEILQKKLQEEVAKKEELALQLKEKNKQLISLNANLTKLVSQKTISLDTLFENILDPYVLMDLFGNVLKMNTEAQKFFGYNSDKELYDDSLMEYRFGATDNKTIPFYDITFNKTGTFYIKGIIEDIILISDSVHKDKERMIELSGEISHKIVVLEK